MASNVRPKLFFLILVALFFLLIAAHFINKLDPKSDLRNNYLYFGSWSRRQNQTAVSNSRFNYILNPRQQPSTPTSTRSLASITVNSKTNDTGLKRAVDIQVQDSSQHHISSSPQSHGPGKSLASLGGSIYTRLLGTKHEPQHHDDIMKELSKVTPNYPSTNAQLWIELNNKKMLIRRTVFFDGRTGLGSSVVIITLHNDHTEKNRPQFAAMVTYHNKTQVCIPVQYWKKVGYIKAAWNSYYVGYLLRIQLEKGSAPPLYIQLTTSVKDCHQNSKFLPAMPVFADIRERKGKFAVCAGKALFHDYNVDEQWIVHWVEFNKALGASFITIFIQNISDKVYRVMKPYIKEGLVEVLDWQTSIGLHEQGQWGSLQECIYRNVNRAQYLNLHDSDEILVPQKHKTWAGMIQDLAKVANISQYASFSFYNAFWFDIGFPVKRAVELKCSKMELPLYFQRTDRVVKPEHSHPKAMVCLDATIAGNIHEIYHWRDGYEMRLKVPIDIGQSHHYRTPMREQDYSRHDRHYDPMFMLPYVDVLMKNIRKQFC